MKSIAHKKASVAKSLLKKITDQHKGNSKNPKKSPTVGSNPLKPAELDQDSGGGYNSDHTFPQT
jgi:hypothetical protein